MAGRGFAPKDIKAYSLAEGECYQHEKPEPPDGLLSPSVDAWNTWFAAWFSWFWTPEDVPALRQVVKLYDQVERGEYQRCGELRLQLEAFGITPKGQQDRRWAPMGAVVPPQVKPGDDDLSKHRAKRDRKLA